MVSPCFTKAIDNYLRELRGTIRSRHACDYFDLFITITGMEGGIWQKFTGTSASSNTVIGYWWWSHDSVDRWSDFNVI